MNLVQVGILEQLPESRKTKAKDFREFLKRFAEEDSLYGDLAKDALSKSSGWTGKTVLSLKKNMKAFGSCAEANETLKQVTLLYEDNQKLTD